ncbi:MAG: hypothetical protein LAQ69_44630 [Acidobacteriia bacterium]|nr:hypothetical protein [Terriglobia bacterium]
MQAQAQAYGQATAVAIDAEGNLFFGDGSNLRVRAIRFGAVLPPPNARIEARGGTPQNAPATTAFRAPLEVLVMESANRPAPGVRVEFSAPTSGASCVFSNDTNVLGVITDRSGRAQANCTAGSQQGSYSVTATPITSSATARFALTNAPPALVSDSVANAASFAGGAVAPGEIVTILARASDLRNSCRFKLRPAC